MSVGKDLRDANLRDANLGGAYLRGAYLRGANLGGADLGGANLGDADLGGADLRGANLGGANLRDADLGGADLRDADLGGAYLRGAYLRGANLGGANLGGAYLEGTCLDIARMPSGASVDWECEVNRNGTRWVIGWRTAKSKFVGDNEYAVGNVYEAPIFSVSNTCCHPGLYLCKTREDALEYSPDVVKVMTPEWEVHEVGKKARTRWFVVVGEEECDGF